MVLCVIFLFMFPGGVDRTGVRASICEIAPNPKIIFCRSQLIFTSDLINKDLRLGDFRLCSQPSPFHIKIRSVILYLMQQFLCLQLVVKQEKFAL